METLMLYLTVLPDMHFFSKKNVLVVPSHLP